MSAATASTFRPVKNKHVPSRASATGSDGRGGDRLVLLQRILPLARIPEAARTIAVVGRPARGRAARQLVLHPARGGGRVLGTREAIDEVQRAVDAGRDSGGRDDVAVVHEPAIRVNDRLRRRLSQEPDHDAVRVASSPSSSPAFASAKTPLHTENTTSVLGSRSRMNLPSGYSGPRHRDESPRAPATSRARGLPDLIDRHGPEPVSERDDVVAEIDDHSPDELFARGFGKRRQAPEVGLADGG